MPKLALEDIAQLAAAIDSIESDPVQIVAGAEIVAVVLGVAQLEALYATQALLARTGALAAIDEGLADLAAGRAEDWRRLRTDYGRGDPDAEVDASPHAVLASHRARWDLDLLPPPAAQRCLDILDSWAPTPGRTLGQQLTAGFPQLSLSGEEGFGLVHRVTPNGVLEVVHISGS